MRAPAAVALVMVLSACSASTGGTDSTTTTEPVVVTTTVPAEPYRDPSRPIDERIEDLLSRATLDEKIGQMTLAERSAIEPAQVTELAVGAILSGGGSAPSPNTPDGWMAMTGSFQDAALATRLGIPILYGSDAVHGHNNLRDATIFPHNVGLGATRSPELVEAIARATAIETAATGVSWNYAPVLAVPRDIRWGRAYEGFSEATDVVTELASAYLRGLQGTWDGFGVLATPKHFVGDGAAEWGTSRTDTYQIDQGDTSISEDELRRIHLAPYIDAIEHGALSVMASYSSFQGTKVHASRWLLTDVLKGELGFEGFVVSDWAAIDQIDPDDYAASVVAAINAGVDMNMVPIEYDDFIEVMRSAVADGRIPIERIDDAVRRILRAKFTLGLFEQPYPDPTLQAAVRSPEHLALAADAVEQSLVLLMHDGATLPADGNTIFVAGDAADDIGWQSGGWTISWQGGIGSITEGSTILDGILEHAEPGARVVFDKTGRFTDEPGSGDVGIVVVAEPPYAEGRGDSPSLIIDPRHALLVSRIHERVDSLVVIVLSGRPVMLGDSLAMADAIVAAWLPGSEGAAVAGPLFGAAPFTGKLPYAWPRSVGQLPFDDVTRFADDCSGPLFPFGHGLTVDQTFSPTPDCEDS